MCLGGRVGGITYLFLNIPLSFPLHTSPWHPEARVTLSGRFTVAASSNAADDRVPSPFLVHQKEKWTGAVGCRQNIHLGSNYAQSLYMSSCCSSYCAGIRTVWIDGVMVTAFWAWTPQPYNCSVIDEKIKVGDKSDRGGCAIMLDDPLV